MAASTVVLSGSMMVPGARCEGPTRGPAEPSLSPSTQAYSLMYAARLRCTSSTLAYSTRRQRTVAGVQQPERCGTRRGTERAVLGACTSTLALLCAALLSPLLAHRYTDLRHTLAVCLQ
eukprot:2390193-Rhodomonas_salina.3